MLARNGVIEPKKLSPTETEAHYHGLRIHLQIIKQELLNEEQQLNQEEWRWENKNGKFVSIATGKPAAPEDLLEKKCVANSKIPA